MCARPEGDGRRMTAPEMYVCPTCGPQDWPVVHLLCHADYCGHPLDRHSPGLRCRVCLRDCGVDCRTAAMRRDGVAPAGRLF